MKKLSVLLLLATLAALQIRCSQFPTRYDRVEANAVRAIGFAYEPCAEAAPGDTMHLKAYFGGEKAASVTWQMSYSHIVTVYGSDTVVDVADLPLLSESSHLPDSVDISFVVPDSTFFLTKAISPQTLAMLKSRLPASMGSMTQQNFAALLKDFGSLDFADPLSLGSFLARWPALGITTLDSASMTSLATITGSLLTVFSVPAVIYANVVAESGAKLKVKGDFTIRYNRRFQKVPEIATFLPVNHNPEVRWVGIYKVLGKNIQSFHPSDAQYAGKFTFSYLYNEVFPDSVRDTVAVNDGYSYFLVADSGTTTYALKAGDSLKTADSTLHILRDTTIHDTTLDKSSYVNPKTGKFERETYFYDWQYQNLALDSVSMPIDSLMAIPGAGATAGGGQPPVMKMLPPLDKKMTHARIWVTVNDQLIGDPNRPTGFAIRTMDIYFKF